MLKDEIPDNEWENYKNRAMDAMYKKADELNGQVSGEHGIGFIKKSYLQDSLDPNVITLMRVIKTVFDPKNILNPEKVVF